MHSSASQSSLLGTGAPPSSYPPTHATSAHGSSSGSGGAIGGSAKVAPRRLHVPASVSATGASRTLAGGGGGGGVKSPHPSTTTAATAHQLVAQQASKLKLPVRVPTTLKASTSPTAHGVGHFLTFSVASAS